MKQFSSGSLSKRFNKIGDNAIQMASDPKWMACSFALGMLTMPFSTYVGWIVMATPTVYTGLGYGYRLAAKALINSSDDPPSPT